MFRFGEPFFIGVVHDLSHFRERQKFPLLDIQRITGTKVSDILAPSRLSRIATCYEKTHSRFTAMIYAGTHGHSWPRKFRVAPVEVARRMAFPGGPIKGNRLLGARRVEWDCSRSTSL